MTKHTAGRKGASDNVKATVIHNVDRAASSLAVVDADFAAFTAADVESVRDPARQFESARKAAFEQGYREGLSSAKNDVEMQLAEADQKVRHALNALEVAVKSLERHEVLSVTNIEDVVVDIGWRIARELLQYEIATDATFTIQSVARCLQFTTDRSDFIARLNPGDVETLNTDSLDLAGRTMTLIADVAVEPGGCILEFANSRIDGQIGTAMNNVRKELGLGKASFENNESFIVDELISKNTADDGSDASKSRTKEQKSDAS